MAATTRAKKNRRSSKGIPRAQSQLAPAHQKFADLLRPCLPMERKFIQYKLERLNSTEAAIKAGYAPKSAEVTGSKLLSRARVREAYEAGLEAAGFGPPDILDDIQALRTFDRSQIERKVLVRTQEPVRRRADEVIEELLARERAVQDMLDGVGSEDGQEQVATTLKARLRALLMERLELQEEVAINPDAVTVRLEQVVVSKRVIDYDLAEQRNLLRFIKGVKPTAFGEVVEVHDWVTGVEMGAKAMGVYRDRMELTGKDGESLGTATVIVLPSNGRERDHE